jgi:hypothetical protein
LIVAHTEDTSALRTSLVAEGFSVEEVRGPYTSEQVSYSWSMKALVNHANAWRIAAGRDLPTIIVEADFVPVKGFGDLPAPIPADKTTDSIAYLYSVGPEVWDLTESHFARGHGGGSVASMIPPRVAELLLDYFKHEVEANPDGEYRTWDSGMGYWLLEKGIETYIPYRHYGEHGGIGNPEHRQFGLGREHRADTLEERLAFLPNYAQGSALRFWSIRASARLWGMLRLISGRFLTWHDLKRSEDRTKFLRFAAGRLFLGARTLSRPSQSPSKTRVYSADAP